MDKRLIKLYSFIKIATRTIAMTVMNSITPKVAAKHELLF